MNDNLKILIYTKSNPFFENVKHFFSLNKQKDIIKVFDKETLFENKKDIDIIIIDLNIRDAFVEEVLESLSHTNIFVVGFSIESEESFYESKNSKYVNLYCRKPPTKNNIDLILEKFEPYKQEVLINDFKSSADSISIVDEVIENDDIIEIDDDVIEDDINLIVDNQLTKEEIKENIDIIEKTSIIEIDDGIEEEIFEDLEIEDTDEELTVITNNIPLNSNDVITSEKETITDKPIGLKNNLEEVKPKVEVLENKKENEIDNNVVIENKAIEVKPKTIDENDNKFEEKDEIKTEIDKIKQILAQRNKRKDKHLTTKDIEKKTNVLSDKKAKEDSNIPLFVESQTPFVEMYRVDEAIIKYRIKKLLSIGMTREDVKESIKTMNQKDVEVQKRIERKMEDTYGISMREKRRREMLEKMNFTGNILETNKEKENKELEEKRELERLRQLKIEEIAFQNKIQEVQPEGVSEINRIQSIKEELNKKEIEEMERIKAEKEREEYLKRQREEELRIIEEKKLQKERERLYDLQASVDKFEDIFEEDSLDVLEEQLRRQKELEDRKRREMELLRIQEQQRQSKQHKYEEKFNEDDDDFFSQTIKNNKKILSNNIINNNDFISFSDIEDKLPSQDLMSLHKAQKRKQDLIERASDNYKPKPSKKEDKFDIAPPRSFAKIQDEEEKEKKGKKGLFSSLFKKNKK